MSKWRVKGFVQDSDEEEEDIEFSNANSARSSQHAHNVGDTAKHYRSENRSNTASKDALVRETSVRTIAPPDEVHDDELSTYHAPIAVAWVAEATSASQQPVASPKASAKDLDARERSESPDPLLGSPTPKAKRVGNHSYSSQILGVPSISQGTQESAFGNTGNGRAKNAYLLDFSDDSDLSDPPSDLDELHPEEFRRDAETRPEQVNLTNVEHLDLTNLPPEDDGPHAQKTIFASPTHRTTVQVVIPPFTNRERQPQVFGRYVDRSFRQRKPIQLHPYLLEGEKYRRDLQGRGVKPVIRVLSPKRKPHHSDQESQEQEFDPKKDLPPNSSPEIPVSTLIVRRRTEGDQGGLGQRILDRPRYTKPTSTIHSSAKRRKPGRSPRPSSASRQLSTIQNNTSTADVWAVPQSPPYSSSPPIDRSVRNQVRRTMVTPIPNLPTPSNSSSVLAAGDMNSDDEPVRSVHRLGQGANQPIPILSDSSSSDTEASENETQGSDHEIQKVGKRIRGVLPASWLRLDLQAQEKRDKQRRDRLHTLQSPGQAEPQRGVAQKVVRRQAMPSGVAGPISTNNRVIELSDESDGDADAPAPQISNAQDSTRAAFETAAMLDRRYADENLDTMENDRLHLFTLGGGKKRKKQSMLTDMFEASKRRKVKERGGKHSKATFGSYATSKARKRTPPPALSILDVEQSPSKEQRLPQFLRIARRQAHRRPDHARQSPTNKYIRLHTAQDTQDANATLREWRRGAIRPRANIAQSSRRPTARRPFVDLDHNQRLLLGDADIALQDSESARQPSSPTGPTQLREKQRLSIRHTNQPKAPTPTRKKLSQHSRPRPLPFRDAQLEGLETDQGSSARRAAFQRGLKRVDRLFDLHQPLINPRNPQLARFLADDDVILPPLPSVESAENTAPSSPIPEPPIIRKRLVRKPRAQRVDVEIREYRQPSEPVVDDYLRGVPDQPILDPDPGQADQPSLQGLGPHGTRYPTTFDVSPLPDGTYFHVTTFVGSGVLRRALALNQSNARNLDEPAGYCNVDCLRTSVRCGPWEDSIAARIADSTNDIWNSITRRNEDDDSLWSDRSCFENASNVTRSLIVYFSSHLSFHDPIDRNPFIIKMGQWATSMYERIMSHGDEGRKSDSLAKARSLGLLLVLTFQIYKIAHHSVVEQSSKSDLLVLITSIGKSLVGDILDHISDLSDFLENNQRYNVRESGIRDSDAVVEGLVICLHTLSQAGLPGITFWDLVGQSLSPAAKRATQLMEFESIWGTIFTLLPFIEFNDLGIPSRGRRTSFREDNWTTVRALLQRTFALYPATSKVNNSSLDDYIRAVMTRCHELVHFWHWNRCDPALYTMFDFFVAKNGLKHLKREQGNGLASFLEQINDGSFSRIEPNTRSFHIFLKCLYIGIRGMQDCYPEKKLRSVVLRLIPNHGRSYPKDQPLEVESLEALQNHHDILCTLYRASPLPCRPNLELIKNLVHHENSHREACRIGIRSWANLAKFQLSSDEPYNSLQPFAQWHQDIKTQTLKQYLLAKTEAEEYLKSDVLNKSEATSLMVRRTMEKNQDQVIASLRDCIAGLLKALAVRQTQVLLKEFLVDAGLVQLLELPHLQDRRLVVVIRDALGVLRAFASLPRQITTETVIPEPEEESQDYGDSFDLADFMEVDHELQQPYDFLQSPLWHLLSNAFGAEASPDDSLLMDCIDTWCLIARCQVSLGARSWTYYLDSFSQVSWQQLRRTEQTQKFHPYFLASVLGYDSTSYSQHRLDFLNALLVSLVDRESLLRFQHRLLSAIITTIPDEPLLKDLPFYDEKGNGSLDIHADTVRARRLALISVILANMRGDFLNAIHEGAARLGEVKRGYAALLKDLMNAMKSNYQQLGSGTTVTGTYVEFVQRVVQFLQQYTTDIHPVLDFFTNSIAFPLPAADPTYVVGRLCGYAPKLSQAGIPKQLSVFVQTIAQQAATGGHQSYLVHQLQTVLCRNEAPPKDRDALRDALLQGIFPAYVEAAFTSAVGFVIAQPILQSLPPIIEAMRFSIRIYDDANVQAICDCLLAISHAFFRGIAKIKDGDVLLRSPYILQAPSLMFEIATPIALLLDYICGRCSESAMKPRIVQYFQSLALFIGEMLHEVTPQSIPSYSGDVSQPKTKITGLLPFSVDGLQSGIKANWSASGDYIYFGQGHAKREVLIDWSTVDEAKTNLIVTMEEFLATASLLNDEARDDEHLEMDASIGELDV
ncbi:Mus7/MMS22 family protein [Paraphaeosphaeria sporulosa]